jgi:hypothetical protein
MIFIGVVCFMHICISASFYSDMSPLIVKFEIQLYVELQASVKAVQYWIKV